jgi:replication factor C subunit 2/4
MTDDSKTKKPADITPWVERYRPNSLEDISHQTEVVHTLQNAVTTGQLPHLLFYGPPGTGKTSVALALCKQLWHPSIWRRRVLELNASDERGIGVVRDKIKHFASLAVGSGQVSSSANKAFFTKNKADDTIQEDETKTYPNPPFKIIILDESDSITPDAQAALRRIIVSDHGIICDILHVIVVHY